MTARKFDKISSIFDLALINSIARPAPIEFEVASMVIDRANGKSEVIYPHQMWRDILQKTYGVFLFQEDLLSVLNKIGGFCLSESVCILKNMCKKNLEKNVQSENQFVENVKTKGISTNVAKSIFREMVSSSSYLFNRSHAISYVTFSYISMWLKPNYNKEWNDSIKEWTEHAAKLKAEDDCVLSDE